jgi:outer membrane protein assembly factor BamA
MTSLSGTFRQFLVAASTLVGMAGQASAFDFSIFVDPEDNYIDASAFLARGGFIPVPVIITEPAVDGGFGIIGQFMRSPEHAGDQPPRTMIGIARTGNGSTAGGIMRAGNLREGDLRYTVGLGLADMTVPIFPFGLDQSIDYNNKNRILFANARTRLGETQWWAGPRLVYRQTDLALGEAELGPVANRVRDRINDLFSDKQYVALGASLHYDTRDNPISPTDGINGVLKYDIYDDAFGSDADFDIGQAAVASFTKFGDDWSFGILSKYKWTSGDNPFFTSPSVDLRGVQSGRYAGDSALSSEIELRKQITSRWAGVVFGGYGESHVSDSNLYESEDGIWTYGAGVRYRLARQMGLDVGLDIAKGPEEHIFYIQFGHAWGREMD